MKRRRESRKGRKEKKERKKILPSNLEFVSANLSKISWWKGPFGAVAVPLLWGSGFSQLSQPWSLVTGGAAGTVSFAQHILYGVIFLLGFHSLEGP